MIAVFAYDFPHRKTQDFLVELALAGHRDVIALAAPRAPLPGIDRTSYWAPTLRAAPPRASADVAAALGFRYERVAHRDVDRMLALMGDAGVTTGIVAGARILAREIIEAVPGGIVNFHPGRIPETSGLDAFFYTIKHGIDAGVTAHFIDARIDAGRHIAFDPVRIGPEDQPATVIENGYQVQLAALRRLLAGPIPHPSEASPIDRPTRNQPMAPDEKHAMVLRFPAWRAARVEAQAADRLQAACAAGDLPGAEAELNARPHLIETRTPEGWTPLIRAAHGQHLETVRMLLSRGADPNAAAAKGTTVLMYAKTGQMEKSEPDMALIDTLLEAGADPRRADMFGKRILDYLQTAPALAAQLLQRGGV